MTAATAGRAAPVALATSLAAAYVGLAPPSADLAAALYRAHLFGVAGFSVWDNGWYSGHPLPGYSILAPAIFWLLGPRLAAGLAAVATAAVFDRWVARRVGGDGRVGSILFAAATAISLYTGRLTLAVGLLPALGAVVALDRGRPFRAGAAALLAGLLSPVAALFAAIAAGGLAAGAIARRHTLRAGGAGALVAAAALGPVALAAIAFPESGTEPFEIATLLPLLAICLGALAAAPPPAIELRAGILLYLAVTVGAFLIPSALGSNVARLGTLLAAPLAGLLWWPDRARWLVALLPALLYVGWQAPVIDTVRAAGDPAAAAGYYRPLLRFLAAQPGVFRTEVVFTAEHWESDWVGGRFPLARGWERQTDRGDNPLFYTGRLTAASYARWLQATAVRFVALPDAALDPSARSEAALVRGGLADLRLAARLPHWRVYAVRHPAGLTSGAAVVTGLGPDWLSVRASAAGHVLLRVRYSPYWALAGGVGCIGPSPGGLTRLSVPHAEALQLVVRFRLDRIGGVSPVCVGRGTAESRK